jgi:hypothetical protein
VPCAEKNRLLNLYQAKVSAHSAAVHDLILTRGKISKQEYERLWATAEKARTDSEASSLAVYRHTHDHGC